MIFDNIKDVIQREIQVDISEIALDTSISELGADSLDLFRIVIELEELYDIRIEDTDDIVTIRDIMDCVDKKIKLKNEHKIFK